VTRKNVLRSLLFVATLLLSRSNAAHAALKFYYDPVTGNVAFDTAATRSGKLHSFVLNISRQGNPPFTFLYENQVRLSTSTFFTSEPRQISDSTQGEQWEGLYTIGNILPANLAETTWTTFFETFLAAGPSGQGSHSYVDIVGGGMPEPAEFLYGAPSGEFKNRLDLVDPDSLSWASHAELRYQPATGEVQVTTQGPLGGYITGLHLKSNGSFLPQGFAPTFTTGPFTETTTTDIFAMVDLIEPGQYSLGEILPAGLSSQQFSEAIASARFSGRAGFKQIAFDFDANSDAFALTFIPEPGAMLISAFGLAALAACERKRDRLSDAGV
jgi:hypothetical protein